MDEYQGSGEWDFRGEDTKEYTHCLHIYPAMMIPQIARRLIELYGTKGGLLFDPYCGTGTSLVEARLYGMDAAGTDLNPTARMIAEAKTRDYDTEQLESDKESFLDGIAEQLAGVSGYEGFEEPEMVSFERLERWFPSRTIGEICTCMERVSMIEDNISRTFISVALSECLRLVSYQRNGEFKLYRIREDQREGHYVPLLPLLEARLERNLAGCVAFCEKAVPGTTASVFGFNTVETGGTENLRSSGGTGAPDLVVTSPPYGDSGTTVAYAQFSWMTNVWLGLDSSAPGALDRSLMGGLKEGVQEFGFAPMDEAISAIAEQDPKRATEVMHFYSEYLRSITNVAIGMSPGAHACYVVGNRTVKGHQLPTDGFTAWAFEQNGFTHEVTYLREIPNKRMPSKNSPTNVSGATSSTMVNEFIVVCKKVTSFKPEWIDGTPEDLIKNLTLQFEAINPKPGMITSEATSTEVYDNLMENIGRIPKSARSQYQIQCMLRLLSLRGERIPNPEDLHPGDIVEETLLGIPRKNNSKLGDMLGLELKSFSGSADLTLGSFSIVGKLTGWEKGFTGETGVENMWDAVFCPSHIKHAESEPTTHFLTANESFQNNEENKLGRLRLTIVDGIVGWEIKRAKKWEKFASQSVEKTFEKFIEGVTVLKISGKKADPHFVIEKVYFYPLSPTEIANSFSNKTTRYEARYDFKDKRKVGGRDLYHGEQRNTGHAFRIPSSIVKNTILKDEYEIDEISDFSPSPYW